MLEHAGGDIPVRCGIQHVEAMAQNADRWNGVSYGQTVCMHVNAVRKPADDLYIHIPEVFDKLLAYALTIRRSISGSDYADSPLRLKICCSFEVEHERSVLTLL